MRKTVIYNGTNHKIRIFSTTDCAVNRSGQYFLKSQDMQPIWVLSQQQPLSVRGGSHFHEIRNGYCLPTETGALMDVLPNYWEFDSIIVSSLFASTALRLPQILPHDDGEYLDRLFTLLPVFDRDPSNAAGRALKVGAVGFKKLTLFRSAACYANHIAQNYQVSLSAVESCIWYHEVCGLPLDPVNLNALDYLRQWLQYQHRAS